ncbi:MAG: hypothetical protein Q8K30_00665 [Candidatus Gracilibacteria bacterium]|nr:hypothetical protein [Candidatus Gracilibacteria bacterium]
MKKILSIILLIFILFSSFGSTCSARNSLFNNTTNQIPYCNDGDDCGLREGIKAIENIDGIENNRSASEYIQDILGYILSFLALIAIIIIIYSGIVLLTGLGDQEKLTKTKNIILYAVFGLVIIFLAGPFIKFVISSFYS